MVFRHKTGRDKIQNRAIIFFKRSGTNMCRFAAFWGPESGYCKISNIVSLLKNAL